MAQFQLSQYKTTKEIVWDVSLILWFPHVSLSTMITKFSGWGPISSRDSWKVLSENRRDDEEEGMSKKKKRQERESKIRNEYVMTQRSKAGRVTETKKGALISSWDHPSSQWGRHALGLCNNSLAMLKLSLQMTWDLSRSYQWFIASQIEIETQNALDKLQ